MTKIKYLHSRWLASMLAILMVLVTLWYTGYINFLLTDDILGIGFSAFIVITLFMALISQYRNVRQERRNTASVVEVRRHLGDIPNFEKHLKNYILGKHPLSEKDSSMGALFERLRTYIMLNPNEPLSEGNIQACEEIIDDDFNLRVNEELEQSENLTKYGMLGTFVGLVWGFSKIDWLSLSADTALSVIGGVIGGVQIALITSILGLICSIILRSQHKKLRYAHEATRIKILDTLQQMSRVLCYKASFTEIVKGFKKPEERG